MKKRFACPGCHAPMTVDPTVDRTAACPECGYRANVRAFIKRIRQKFRDVDTAFTQIENYPGFGYRWNDVDAGTDQP